MKKLFLFLYLISNIILYSYDKKQKDFEIVLPCDWVNVTRETAEFLVLQKDYPANDPAYENYDYLFQHKWNDTLFSTPYILICVNYNKRLTKSQLKEYGSDYYRYDPETNYLWKYKESTLEVIIPTEKGTINVFCYSTKTNFSTDKTVFKKIVNSIFVNPDIRYQSNILRDIPIIGKLFETISNTDAVVLVIIVSLFAALYNLKRKKKLNG